MDARKSPEERYMTVAARHADITTQDIVCDSGMPAFLAYPAGGGPFPTVILMHERYGLVKHTRDQAMRSARDGFAVLAPNFFFRHSDQRILNAGDSRYDMTDPESVELIRAALAEIMAALPCPVFGAFGETDHIISLDDVRRFRDSLERHKKSYDIHVYKGAPHGWLNDTMPGRYRKPQADAGWAAQQRFLTEVFGGGYDSTTIRWQFGCASSPSYDFSKNVRLE